MTKYLKAIFFALLCTVVFVGCAKDAGADVVSREIKTIETTLNGNYTKAQVKKAIVTTTTKRKWKTANKSADVLRATYARGTHKVVVDIAYTGKKISVSYVSSEDMKYQEKNGVASIHKNYYRWVGNIGNDVKMALGDF